MKRKSLAFGKGWYHFVLDHSIDAGEFVVFRKVGESMFSVQFFSISGCERLSFYETEKRSGNKRKRMQTVVPDVERLRMVASLLYIQEVTCKEERRARCTNAIIRRLIMENIENEDLLVKDKLPILTPIATMPSEDPLSVCSHKMLKLQPVFLSVECLATTKIYDMMCTERNDENNGSVCNGIERGKCETVSITTDKKNRYDGAKMTGEDPHFFCENDFVQDAAFIIESGDQIYVDLSTYKDIYFEYDAAGAGEDPASYPDPSSSCALLIAFHFRHRIECSN